MSSVSDKSVSDIENEFIGKQYGEFKKAVADAVIAKFDPIRIKYEELMTDKAYLESVLKRGAAAAQRRADKMMSKVYRKAGYVDAISSK